jgi:hypothetical protein
VLGFAPLILVVFAAPKDTMIEFRRFKTKPGKRPQLCEILNSRTLPTKNRVTRFDIVGLFLPEDDPNTMVVFLGFPDLISMCGQLPRGYQLWQRRLEELIFPILEECDVVLMDDQALIRFEKSRFAGFQLKNI